ncbi:MAG: hypothetical protein A2915_04770 [Candidatus Yanofskybacteria bacterium RIFCSPLOWO2_01_FULL_41_34]|uniref:Uncharacterized protein n=1 Tax=Candidatus Yanofskybacteria bacterium RIFCSPHIGHO2_01_FULL_41_26 TaxID=1802661 RepID=A0A1F8ED32_9BACT|nr:MAG: hypothetical protein A2649_04350 [Candidatus Yanofskybacteria bacterium RIFCSPHIGHO2_01_FULL_41_26]OGN22000.1 MAG: hypothetical protein A2915_04770 [Candidatus Yanofskybacteria bacterium RIFCSPLOWO2_01_FULL_41_34]
MKHYPRDVCWADTPLEHFIAILIFIAALAVLFPWGLHYSTEVRNLSEENIIPTDVALEEMRQLLVRIDQPGFTPTVAHQVIKRAVYIERHTPWVSKVEKEKAGDDYSQLRTLEIKNSAIFRSWSQIAQNARDKFRKDRAAADELFKLEKNDTELQALFDFRPVTTTYHWNVIGRNFWTKLPFAFALAILFFVAMIKARKLNLVVELMNPLSLILATATFPVSWMVYPYKDPDQQMSKVVNVMGMAFSLLMTFSGVAAAQTIKKSDKKKRDQQVMLQIDMRAMIPLVGDDQKNTTIFNRATLNFKQGVVENISLGKPSTGFWYSELCGGPWLGKVAGAKVLAVGCVTKSKGAEAGWTAGFQVYKPLSQQFFLAMPVIRVEQSKTFNFYAAVSTKINDRWSIVPDVALKFTSGKRPFVNAGIVLRRTFGARSAEVGILRNNANQTIFRPRLIQNFAF